MEGVKVYKGKEKINLLYEQLKRADNWGTAKDVDYMRGIYGHCVAKLDDFDDLDILPIVDCSTQDEADKLEKLYTEMYEKDYDLLNVKKANDPPPEIKEKISNTLKKTLNS